MADVATRIAYTLADAAMQASHSLATIRRAIDRGELRRVYANSKPVVLHTDLVAWLTSLPESPPSTPKKK